MASVLPLWVGAAILATAPAVAAQTGAVRTQEAERISVRWIHEPLLSVLIAFADFSGKSIVPGANVAGFVTAEIVGQPWDVALETILASHGLAAREDVHGIIRVDDIGELNEREAVEPVLTRAYRINYTTAEEVARAIRVLMTERGNATVGQSTNTLIVSDIARVQDAVRDLLTQIDTETPQVSIKAKIVFINRTGLEGIGITYELRDSRGNRFNALPGVEGGPESGSEDGGTAGGSRNSGSSGTATVALGGNSIAALGNAAARISGPALRLLVTLVLGRHELIGFIDALQSIGLSYVEAEPQVMTLDNQQAEIHVGELTPIRTIEAGAGSTSSGNFPTAQVGQQETGIILRATPHVTAGGRILLDLEAERSAAEPADSDTGYIFRTQRARTRVLVDDGETVVIGGLVQSEHVDVRQGGSAAHESALARTVLSGDA